jgi:HEAT repeat protein
MNDYPEVRRKACLLLGKLGGDKARAALMNILAKDTNQHVKAEAINALAAIGDNENGDVLKTIVWVYRDTYNPDSNFVIAIINAVKKIAKESYSSSYGDALIILTEIQVGNYTNYIRTEAYKAIEYLNSE